MARKMGLHAGSAMDLRTGFDFTCRNDRERVKKRIKEEKPRLLVGSPECTMFSTLQQLSPWTIEKAKKLNEAKAHMKFVCELYQDQIEAGGLILHEHPLSAASWKLEVVSRILKLPGVKTVVGDQCQFGLTTYDQQGKKTPARKRTRFMSNCPEILQELGKMCPGKHVHQPLIQGRARAASIYPDGLCRAICRGLIKNMKMEKTRSATC